ncbi:MAG: hypothetical protein K1X66_08205 [Verrucomicrobiae bacterium]|nr:hypothetical protein [Verrucomicrobiae bacterium]
MISCSILFNGSAESERQFFASLNINIRDVLFWGGRYSFLEARRNGALAGTVSGDFMKSMDLYLFDIDETTLFQRLAEAAMENVRIAMPDEESKQPWNYLLWENGIMKRIRIIEDDDRFLISAYL